jgi:hypothetical protein
MYILPDVIIQNSSMWGDGMLVRAEHVGVLESCVGAWLERVSPAGGRVYGYRWAKFLDWLRLQPGWGDATGEGLLAFQEEATGRRRYELLNLIQRHVKELGGSRNGMLSRYTAMRSFFLHNRVELPKDRWDPGAGTREPARGKLNLDHIRLIVQAAGLRDRAVFLTLFQSMMDLERFLEFNKKHGEELVEHLRSRGVDTPLRIDFTKGRKTNHDPFYTFLGRDALQAWKEYFEKERGWPESKEPVAVVRETNRSPSKQAIRSTFYTLCIKFKLRERNPGKGDRGHRTGVNLHEFRDVVRSYLQIAKREGLDETCVEFWMGHQVDPLAYNKFATLEPRYVEENYKTAEKYLNILSHTMIHEEQRRQEQETIQRMEKEMEKMRKDWLEVRQLLSKLPAEKGPDSIPQKG